VSIERKHFPLLAKNEYAVCEKSDGVRHVLIIFMFENVRLSVMINRALVATVLTLTLPKNAYDGTVLDGELVNEKLFLVYDAVKVAGTVVANKTLIERLAAAEPILKVRSVARTVGELFSRSENAGRSEDHNLERDTQTQAILRDEAT